MCVCPVVVCPVVGVPWVMIRNGIVYVLCSVFCVLCVVCGSVFMYSYNSVLMGTSQQDYESVGCPLGIGGALYVMCGASVVHPPRIGESPRLPARETRTCST